MRQSRNKEQENSKFYSNLCNQNKRIKHEYEYEINTCHGGNKYDPCIPDRLGQIEIHSSLFKIYKVQTHNSETYKEKKITNRITATKNIDIHQRKHFQNANTKIPWPAAPTVVDGIGMIYHT